MKLRLSEWASVAEIVSGIAVLVTLVILISSVRENTETIRTSSYAANIDSIMELETEIISDPDLSRIYYLMKEGDYDQLEGADLYRAVFIESLHFRTYEKAYFMRQRGLLGSAEWERFRRSLCAGYTAVQHDDDFGAMVGFDTMPLTQEFKDFTRESCN